MSVLQIDNKEFSVCPFVFPTYTFASAGNIIIYTSSQFKNSEKYFINYTIKVKMPTLAGNKQIFHPSFHSHDALFPFFDRKRTDVIHQRWRSQWLFPRRHFVYSFKKFVIHSWRILRTSIVIKVIKRTKTEKKYKMQDFGTKIHLINIFMLIWSSINLCVLSFFRNERKLVALLNYTSFRRVATSSIS